MTTPVLLSGIHDMSGFGRCSLTVAIPILSAMGVQCCPYPQAFLSTHTGGFTGFTFLDMTEEMPKVAAPLAGAGPPASTPYTAAFSQASGRSASSLILSARSADQTPWW